MSDFESYLTHCFDLLLQEEARGKADDEERCACASLIERQERRS